MRGVGYVVDASGRRKSVVIDLKTWGKLWEDFQDVMVAESRMREPTAPWDKLKAETEAEDKRAA
jgi:hypothetical protein